MSTGTARARFDAVCFDCDSTLSRIEGIDELAKRAGCEAEIAALTKAAMNGQVPLDAVYGKRLERVRPGRADLDWLAQRYVEEIVPGARETIHTLVRLGKPAYVVSGGILGREGINISRMQIGAAAGKTESIALIGIARPLKDAALEEIRKLSAIKQALQIEL